MLLKKLKDIYKKKMLDNIVEKTDKIREELQKRIN